MTDPPDRAHPVPTARDHTALFYRDHDEYLDCVAAFVREGVLGGESVTVAVPAPNLDPLRARCAADGVGERVRWLDIAHVGGNPGRLVPAVLHPVLHLGARVVTEVVWPGRTPAAYRSCVRHEALTNSLLDGRAVRVLCPYDARRLRPGELADALATHPGVLEHGARRLSPRYAPQVALETYNQPFPETEAAVELEVDSGRLATARGLAGERARDVGLDEEQAGDVALVVTELLTNSVEHGGGAAVLRLWADADGLVCEVRDRGRLVDQLAGLRPAPHNQPNGRGLLLVNTLADLVAVHTGAGGTTIRAHFARRTGA
ncbi:sensor histidine kinase [Actinokineospora sp. PR83]|uniref:sensor histidine kinase n=1 Tax=Actinokineospora sp. PR83 TaxID=2884908 RepID=UPI001F42D1E7|nr:sensor histidine kinase [Actinokineospora sp. PR83]MCG8914272.1 sensor histidine kinase [Actinokineospora sp. PR83]